MDIHGLPARKEMVRCRGNSLWLNGLMSSCVLVPSPALWLPPQVADTSTPMRELPAASSQRLYATMQQNSSLSLA